MLLLIGKCVQFYILYVLVLLDTDVFSVFVKWMTVVFALLGVKYLIVVYSKSAYLYFIENVVTIFRKRSYIQYTFSLFHFWHKV